MEVPLKIASAWKFNSYYLKDIAPLWVGEIIKLWESAAAVRSSAKVQHIAMTDDTKRKKREKKKEMKKRSHLWTFSTPTWWWWVTSLEHGEQKEATAFDATAAAAWPTWFTAAVRPWAAAIVAPNIGRVQYWLILLLVGNKSNRFPMVSYRILTLASPSQAL